MLVKDKNYQNEISELKGKFEKSNIELREDMLKLLQKYENKFQTRDDEIDILKQKCEMIDCKVCNYQSFKVHFFNCEECNFSICTNCLQVCKNCRKARCLECLKKCNNCQNLLCKDCYYQCVVCSLYNCKECFTNCFSCKTNYCNKCLIKCRKCEKSFCTEKSKKCTAKCEKCFESVSCMNCYEKDGTNERCLCGKLYCFNCEDECKECTLPMLWDNGNRIFQGFHTRSANCIPNKCLIKLFIIHKGIDTSHIGLTSDSEFKVLDKATENFWSICLNSGEKFSTSDYKKKGIPWGKYAIPSKIGDTIYVKYIDGEVNFLINRKEYSNAFHLDKSLKYYLYCLTHDDSTKIEIKCLKAYK
jgi:hypothetical protein